MPEVMQDFQSDNYGSSLIVNSLKTDDFIL